MTGAAEFAVKVYHTSGDPDTPQKVLMPGVAVATPLAALSVPKVLLTHEVPNCGTIVCGLEHKSFEGCASTVSVDSNITIEHSNILA